MEHRWSARKPMNGIVVVDYPPLGLIEASLQDISLGGMLVETGTQVPPVNSPVMLAFKLPRSDDADYYRLHAMVVRTTPKGAGLMYLDLDTGTIHALRGTLYGGAVFGSSRGEGRAAGGLSPADLPSSDAR